jgi:hypothetical protein
MYQEKYLKYKNKYLSLKEQLGGSNRDNSNKKSEMPSSNKVSASKAEENHTLNNDETDSNGVYGIHGSYISSLSTLTNRRPQYKKSSTGSLSIECKISASINSNLQYYETEDDGNSMYSSIALDVYGDKLLHRLVRRECITYLESNRDTIFLDEDIEPLKKNEMDEYIKEQKKDGVEGEYITLLAAAKLYKRPIYFYELQNYGNRCRVVINERHCILSKPDGNQIYKGRPISLLCETCESSSSSSASSSFKSLELKKHYALVISNSIREIGKCIERSESLELSNDRSQDLSHIFGSGTRSMECNDGICKMNDEDTIDDRRIPFFQTQDDWLNQSKIDAIIDAIDFGYILSQAQLKKYIGNFSKKYRNTNDKQKDLPELLGLRERNVYDTPNMSAEVLLTGLKRNKKGQGLPNIMSLANSSELKFLDIYKNKINSLRIMDKGDVDSAAGGGAAGGGAEPSSESDVNLIIKNNDNKISCFREVKFNDKIPLPIRKRIDDIRAKIYYWCLGQQLCLLLTHRLYSPGENINSMETLLRQHITLKQDICERVSRIRRIRESETILFDHLQSIQRSRKYQEKRVTIKKTSEKEALADKFNGYHEYTEESIAHDKQLYESIQNEDAVLLYLFSSIDDILQEFNELEQIYILLKNIPK